MPGRVGPVAFARGLRPGAQSGAASLIAVMVLFFVVSMVAAYTNRNMLFEQRTSANQQRSTRAVEAADAGVEWALSMLNSGRTTDACEISALATDTSFRDRYLVIDPDKATIVPKKRSGGPPALDLYPTCVNVAGVWTCSCPTDAAPVVAAAPGSDAFRVRFRRVCGTTTAPDSACVDPVQPGIIHVDVNGCTTPDEECLRFNDEATPGKPLPNEGRATVHVIAALMGALPTSPKAALTARGSIDFGAAALTIDRGEPSGTTLFIHSGGSLTATGLSWHGAPPGTPSTSPNWPVAADDAKLAALSTDRFFSNTFGMSRSTYGEQPAVVAVDCTGGCNAAGVLARWQLNPGRVLLLNGDVDLDSAVSIGTAGDPAVLNVTGTLSFSADATVTGLVYSQAANWALSGQGKIVGAAIGESAISGAPTGKITYDPAVLDRLRISTGSFVKVPGSWKDFES